MAAEPAQALEETQTPGAARTLHAVPSEPHPGEPVAACDQCQAILLGRFCHLCGEDNAPPVRSFRALAEDFLDSVVSYTGQMPVTYLAMFARPTHLLEALRRGDARRYLPPFKLYVTATVIFFLLLSLAGVAVMQLEVVRTGKGAPQVQVATGRPVLLNFRLEERWLHHHDAVAKDRAAVAALDRATKSRLDDMERAYLSLMREVADDPKPLNDEIGTWAPRALWLMMPLYALLLWPFFGRGRYLSELAVFALWAHTLMFLVLILGAAWNFTGLGFGLAMALVAYQAYLTIGLKGYFRTSWPVAALKGAAHSALYLGLLWAPLVAAFFFFQALGRLPSSYWE